MSLTPVNTLTPNGNAVYWGTAVPLSTDGITWNVGDMVINTTPGNAQSIGWVCTAAGNPGSWLQFGATVVDVTYSMLANASLATQPIFCTGTQKFIVAGVVEEHSVAGTDAGTVTLDVTIDATTVAPGAGTSVLSAPISLKATANVVQVATLTATTANLTMPAGSRLSVKYTGTLTTVAGVVCKVVLQKV